MRFTAILVSIFASIVAAQECQPGEAWCKDPNGYGREFYACSFRGPIEASCQEGSACCNVRIGDQGSIVCQDPGSC